MTSDMAPGVAAMEASDGRPATIGERILIACIGNIFLGDDGFGVEVAARLQGHHFPPGVEVVDFGIRGLDLAYRLLDGCDTLVLVDAVPRGAAPGTLYLIEIEPDLERTDDSMRIGQASGTAPDGHSMEPAKVLGFARALGARPQRILLVGCEPEQPGTATDPPEELRMGLSPPVRAAVAEAVEVLDGLVAQLLKDSGGTL